MLATDIYGTTSAQTPSYGPGSPIQHAGFSGDIPTGWKGLVNPANPLMWFGVVLAVTVGLAGLAGSVRLGRAKLSASIDQS
jgi:hypothetical protein